MKQNVLNTSAFDKPKRECIERGRDKSKTATVRKKQKN